MAIGKHFPRVRLGTDLVAYYNLNLGFYTTSKVFDYSRRGHTGTVIGTSCLPQYPGFNFDGSKDYIEIADHPDFTPILTPFSISVWVNMHDSQSFRVVSKWDVAGGVDEWYLETGVGSRLLFELGNGSDIAWIGRYYNTSLAAYENQWIHLVATYDGGKLSTGLALYLNAVRIDDETEEGGDFNGIRNTAEKVHIGKRGATWADGLFGEIMIYKKALTATEIKGLYRQTKRFYVK